MTLGGNLLDFTGNLRSPIASVTTVTFVFNSVVSTLGAKCILADIKHFSLKNILPEPEFMRIPSKTIPKELVVAYNLVSLVENQECIYMRIEKGIY